MLFLGLLVTVQVRHPLFLKKKKSSLIIQVNNESNAAMSSIKCFRD